MKQNLLHFILFLLVTVSAISCGTKVGTGATAEVNVNFTNNTAGSRAAEMRSVGLRSIMDSITLDSTTLLGQTPTIYSMKLVVFYLIGDKDANQNNIGTGVRFWQSNKCDSDLNYCGVDPDYNHGYMPDYFDFARGTAAVNADFSAYAAEQPAVQPGTYRYIDMDFTGPVRDTSDRSPNLKFGTTTANEVRAQQQAVTVRLSEPLVVNAGETITVNLSYDLEKRYYPNGTYAAPPSEVSSSQKWTCNGTTSNIPCIVEVEFTPTVTKD